jgi:hypothetical protein
LQLDAAPLHLALKISQLEGRCLQLSSFELSDLIVARIAVSASENNGEPARTGEHREIADHGFTSTDWVNNDACASA